MTIYNSILDVPNIHNINSELVTLLKVLEEVNPCNQRYEVYRESFMISYRFRINLLNFLGKVALNINAQIIGLPISICEKSYFGNGSDIIRMIQNKKGLKIVLNADDDLGCKGLTLSTFIFYNNFNTFSEYVDRMRHTYRRRVNKALLHRGQLLIRELNYTDFTTEHYSLYKSVMTRTDNPLEILDIEFFRRYNSRIYEFLDKKTNRLLGFIQLKEIEDTLYFMFCGFNKEDNEPYDLYYNMLLKIIEEGIEKGVKKINFGQTSEETKLKIGCKMEPRYLGIYHSNRLLNYILQLLLPMFSYKPYKVVHNVFKEVVLK